MVLRAPDPCAPDRREHERVQEVPHLQFSETLARYRHTSLPFCWVRSGHVAVLDAKMAWINSVDIAAASQYYGGG